MVSIQLRQDPFPGKHVLRFAGDTITFSLTLPEALAGRAFLRTNLGYGSVTRSEIIRQIENDEPPLAMDWFNVPMVSVDAKTFSVTLPLCEPGHYEAKCCFLRHDDPDPCWPEGPNTQINVEPSETCCANTIYNAFVRQFGPNKKKGVFESKTRARLIEGLDQAGYTVIPRSGTFRDLIEELDFIIGTLGCRIIQLLPVHPTPTTYARMGRFGSPYASLSFTAVDPAQARFDPKATPMEQFLELVDAVHARDARIILDVAINHTGWAARLHETHPEWLVRDKDGRIKEPGAWGVVWSDLTRLDYAHKDLWQYMADVFLTWCKRGVDGFRCDAGYMIPVDAWRYITAAVRDHFPDTVFFLEGLGGKICVTHDILNQAAFNWAYSELFQNYDRGQLEHYLPEVFEISSQDGLMIHFAETHDNNRLAARSQTYATMRTALCAMASNHGGFAFANGLEWLATEKIDVHQARSLNWGAKPNLVGFIRRLNQILSSHPAFFDQVDFTLAQTGPGNHVVIERRHAPTKKSVLVVANLDDTRPVRAFWDAGRVNVSGQQLFDLLAENPVKVVAVAGQNAVDLLPGQVLLLTADPGDLRLCRDKAKPFFSVPPRVLWQQCRATALAAWSHFHFHQDLSAMDPDALVQELVKDPVQFITSLNPDEKEPRVISWNWPLDQKREVMVPPGYFVLARAKSRFRARLVNGQRVLAVHKSLPANDGSWFALFAPLKNTDGHLPCTLDLAVFQNSQTQHVQAPLLFLANPDKKKVTNVYSRREMLDSPGILLLGTSGKGAMLRAHAAWSEIHSRYDALLAANLSPDVPEDRHIFLTRCRAWLVYRGYSQEIKHCLDSFFFDYDSRGTWRFFVPSGQGQHVLLSASVQMMQGQNTIRFVFFRHLAKGLPHRLDDLKSVRLILRPDLEDRNHHDSTKAYAGPENHFPASVSAFSNGFVFSPSPRRHLRMESTPGGFYRETQWQYMVYRKSEEERGQDPYTDLFSPGYFQIDLLGGQSAVVDCLAGDSRPAAPENKSIPLLEKAFRPESLSTSIPMEQAIRRAMDQYIVERGTEKSVIAGFPWFLDWGRDALIFVRGLIAAGKLEDAGSILKLFGQFEQNGTLPNMIQGTNAANRDTSDAPLWFILGCAEMAAACKTGDFLHSPCGQRSVLDVCRSIVSHYMSGTPNGIRMDPETSLIFSPAHFTWMDTSFPAGTPRQGYPIEIQALWHAALVFLSQALAQEHRQWKQEAIKVRGSIKKYFFLQKEGYLADCLFAEPHMSACKAIQDDSLRPNQVFALTLGAVRDGNTARQIVLACQELLVPGAIRTLADRPVRIPLPIQNRGVPLNDPSRPYWGAYTGDEDTRRKPAYHNGTAWTWVFPSFCEAWVYAFGKKAAQTALAWLFSSSRLIRPGAAGHIPEILDGDFPHSPRGCDAQAWSASEWFRVWEKLS